MLVRRGMWAAVVAGVLAMTASGCGTPEGTDGDLLNQWSAMGSPQGWAPQPATCLSTFNAVMPRTSFVPVDCLRGHRYETVHIGEFAGAAAEAAEPPAAASDGMKSAWTECDAKVSEFLGGPWQERKVWIGVSVPTSAAWEGGARWHICQLGQVRQLNDTVVLIQASLKGQFDQAELKFGCYQVEKDGKYVAVDCAQPHNAEFAGVMKWDTSFQAMLDESKREDDELHTECQKVVTSFAGGQVRTGTWNWYPAEEDWNAGDRTIRCYLYLEDVKVSQSLAGVGTDGWPIKG